MAGEKLRSIRNYVFRYARALDVARWNYHFEGGSPLEVLKALVAYKNSDGGFGHGIEPDNQNPNSSPMGTRVAVRVLRELDFPETARHLIRDMHLYLLETEAFDGVRWAATVPSNNDWPHAPWWKHTGEDDRGYNPTAELAGFLLRTADPGSRAYILAEEIIRRMLQKADTLAPKGHELANFTVFLEDITAAKRSDLLPEGFAEQVAEWVHTGIEQNQEVYTKDADLFTPKYYISGKDSPYFEKNRAICEFYAEWLEESVGTDGAWEIPWTWDPHEMTHIAKRDWQGSLIVDNMLYLQGMKPDLITVDSGGRQGTK